MKYVQRLKDRFAVTDQWDCRMLPLIVKTYVSRRKGWINMSLQFVIGSSGSGKTRYLYENLINLSMEHPEGNYIAIVPEQFTMQTQKEIVTLHPNHGSMNIDIVSFQRLAYRIFEELGVEHLEVLDDMGKSMVLRRVAAGQKKNLGLYGSHLNQTGFVNQLKSMLSELYQYGIQPENLREAMEHAGPLLCEKLHDISVVYEAFQQEIQEKYITAEEILDVLCRVLPRSELIRKSVVTLDGYTGFTPVQYRIVELLMRYAKQVIITVSIDPEEKPYERTGIDHLFYMGKEKWDSQGSGCSFRRKMSATVPEQSSHCFCGEEFIPLWTEVRAGAEGDPGISGCFSRRGGVICGIHDPPFGAGTGNPLSGDRCDHRGSGWISL